MNELLRSVDGPVGRYVDTLVNRMMIEAEGICPVGPPPEFPSARYAHPHLFTLHERTRVYPTPEGLAASFGIDGRKAPYAAAVHNGSKAHLITAKFAKTLRFRNRTRVVVFPKSVIHPATLANPWLLRAAHRILHG